MRNDKLSDEEGRLAALRRYDFAGSGDNAPFERVAELVRDVLAVPIVAATLVDNDRLVVIAHRGAGSASSLREPSFSSETIRQRGPLAVPDALADPRFCAAPSVIGAPHLRSYLGVPLVTPEGYNIGALAAADTEPRPFDSRQAAILEKLAQIVVEQLELRQIARQDPLTGALTRRGFFAEVDKEFARASRYDRPSALAIIDVDEFKTINDRYGHPAGDAVLISIAAVAMATMRRTDVFGRIAGGQFGLLLPETDAEEARDAVDRIRRLVAETIVETAAASIHATVSCGVASIPAAAEGVSAWHAEADIALYEAKQFGRNRVVAARPRRPVTPVAMLAQQAARPH